MNKKYIFPLLLLISVAFFAWRAIPVAASSQPQVRYLTPTPGADGRILYIVQAGDTCTAIYLKTNVSLDQIKKLNNLSGDCTIIPGQKLVLGVTEPPAATAAPQMTPTSLLPRGSTSGGNGMVCVFLYGDLNGNALRDADELPIPGGAVSLNDRLGKVSKTAQTTTDPNPLCWNDIPAGDYNISMAPPQGFNPTTNMNYPITILPGDSQYINFGTQPSIAENPPTPSGGNSSPLLAIAGGILIIGGIGLGIYFRALQHK